MDPELEAFIGPTRPTGSMPHEQPPQEGHLSMTVGPINLFAFSPRRRSTCSPRPDVRQRPGLHH
jgi:hypothetical protein